MAERLWAPWRIEYIRRTKPEDGCVLCDSAALAPSRTSFVLARRSAAYVLLNIYPYAAGHLMVVPERHVADLADLTEAEHAALWSLTRDALVRVRRATNAEGVNLGANFGAAAGAGIREHLHVHLVPRWSGDHNFMPVLGDTRVMNEYLEATWDRLAPDFADLNEP